MSAQSISELRSNFIKSIKEEKKKFPDKIGWKVIHQMSVSGNIDQWAKELKSLDTRGRGRDKRRSIRARYIGLLTEDMDVTDPGREFYKAVLENHPDIVVEVLNKQFEKWYFPVAEFQYTPSDYENYTQLGYGLYPCFFILRVLFYLGERDTKVEPRFSISIEEFLFFCLTAKRHDDYKEIGELILDFRRNSSEYKELRFLIKADETYIERVLQEVQLSSYISVENGRIILKNPDVSRERLLKFEYLMHTQNLIDYETDKRQYFELLYNSLDLIEFHKRLKKIDLSTDVILLDYIADFIESQGFIYDDTTLRSFYASLKAKPFIIVTGLSGTGKTKLCELFAEAVCENPRRQFMRIPVRPDWNDDRFMLGFFNPLTERYHYEPFLEFLMQASSDSSKPYFVCLDEMNLAHVEYYFSAFLSGLESLDKIVPLHNFPSVDELENLKTGELDELCNKLKINASNPKEKKELLKSILQGLPPGRLRIPPNLFFTGTVNIDETTYQFSPKVLDRANVIEFMKVDIAKNEESKTAGLLRDEVFYGVFKQCFLSFPEDEYKKWRNEHWREIVEERLAIIHRILEKSSLHFGYRTREEILRFIYCSKDLLKLSDALDLQIKQRILPKIKGPETVKDTLLEFREKLAEWGYSRSLEKLDQMVERLEQGYTSYF
jgi:hypothetical protein